LFCPGDSYRRVPLMDSKLICAVFIAALFAVGSCGELFNPKRLNFIDYSATGNNWLFRGNQPTNSSKQFPYELLVDTMRQKATLQANKTLPSMFYLMDLSFESYERSDINLEKDFFDQNPTLGNYTEWILIGDFTAPTDYPKDLMKLMAEDLADWQIDRLPERLPRIKKMLDTPGPNGLPIVIYIHCEAGSDRTGEFSGSYYLQFQGYPSYKQALAVDDTIAGRPIEKLSAHALQWYCYYLQYKLNFNVDCTAPINSTRIAVV